ncbi:MAG TPA: hypothetical protein VFY39_07010, partial [Gammaproteobacteria bacterium]|nr:hypothetical protein [Gammaproteobacteria bacterium]
DLDIEPIRLRLREPPRAVMDSSDWLWYNPSSDSIPVGIAAPIRSLLQRLSCSSPMEADPETLLDDSKETA